jgi:MbtH protein
VSEPVDKTIYTVVVNHELQYSIWPQHKEVPLGWAEIGQAGSKQVCLEHVEGVWVDMRPTSVRIHLEQLERERVDRGEPRIQAPMKPEVTVLKNVAGYKATDKDGLPFFSKDRAWLHSEAKILQQDGFDAQPYPGAGLHFSRTLEDAVGNGVAAAVWDDRYFPELKDEWFSSPALHRDGIRVFKVLAPEAAVISDSVLKAPCLEIQKEISLESSAVWPLLVAFRKWEESHRQVTV